MRRDSPFLSYINFKPHSYGHSTHNHDFFFLHRIRARENASKVHHGFSFLGTVLTNVMSGGCTMQEKGAFWGWDELFVIQKKQLHGEPNSLVVAGKKTGFYFDILTSFYVIIKSLIPFCCHWYAEQSSVHESSLFDTNLLIHKPKVTQHEIAKHNYSLQETAY